MRAAIGAKSLRVRSGSLIVDGLSSYKAPAFVYIVPNGELRGGAWVVLDPTINQNGMMEMCAQSRPQRDR